MGTSLQKVIGGIRSYLETELVAKFPGWGKWIVGAGVSLALDNGVNLFNSLKSNEIIRAMNIIDENDCIDIDRVEKAVMEQAEKSAVTFKAPVVGAVTLTKDDVKKIFQLIRSN